MRKHYIDNLRWLILLILIPYHTAQAWNTWGEPNYIFFEGNRLISSFIVFFSPFFMPLLFVLAGIGTKYALQKRTIKEYLAERVRRLLIPLLYGTLLLTSVMSYIADKFHHAYSRGFISHYGVFFTKFTDLTGADGGFSVGQFWFVLYLFVISILSVSGLSLLKNRAVNTDEKMNREADEKPEKSVSLWLIFIFGLPLPMLSDLLSIGGKSLAEYLYLFLLGYLVFSDDRIISKLEKYAGIWISFGLAAAVLNVYLFLWADGTYELLNDVAKYLSEWVMVLALLGLAKRYMNFHGPVSEYMKKRSFLFFTYHFIWVVVIQYFLYGIVGNQTFILFAGTVLLAYLMTFVCCEISIRIPVLCFLTGVKKG